MHTFDFLSYELLRALLGHVSLVNIDDAKRLSTKRFVDRDGALEVAREYLVLVAESASKNADWINGPPAMPSIAIDAYGRVSVVHITCTMNTQIKLGPRTGLDTQLSMSRRPAADPLDPECVGRDAALVVLVLPNRGEWRTHKEGENPDFADQARVIRTAGPTLALAAIKLGISKEESLEVFRRFGEDVEAAVAASFEAVHQQLKE